MISRRLKPLKILVEAICIKFFFPLLANNEIKGNEARESPINWFQLCSRYYHISFSHTLIGRDVGEPSIARQLP